MVSVGVKIFISSIRMEQPDLAEAELCLITSFGKVQP